MPAFMDTQAASSLFTISRPSTPAPKEKVNKALRLVRSLSIGDLPKKFKRTKTRHRSASPPPPPVPQLPPLAIHTPPHDEKDDNGGGILNVHFDALEFLTLDPEPWVGVSVAAPPSAEDFGLLPSDFRLTRRDSLLSLYSFYTQKSYDGAVCGGFPNSSPPTSPASILADLYEQDDDAALRTPSDSPSPTPLPRGSPRTGYVTHNAYLPEFRNSVIMLDKPAPPRPPRRRPSDHHSRSRSHRSRAGDSPPKAAPLLTRRLTSSSTTSLNHSLREVSTRDGSMISGLASSSSSGHDGSMRSVLSRADSSTDLTLPPGMWLKSGS